MTARRRAFTIIELLAVLGVITLLLAIAFPVLSSVRRGQRKKRVSAAITAIGLAVESYQNDFGVFPLADPPTSVLAASVPNRGNWALVHWLQAGEDAHGRSAPYLPSSYYDESKQIEADTLRDEWERPYIYFDTASMKASVAHDYDLRGNRSVKPAEKKATNAYCNFGRFQLWSAGPNEANDGGPNPRSERDDDIGNFVIEE